MIAPEAVRDRTLRREKAMEYMYSGHVGKSRKRQRLFGFVQIAPIGLVTSSRGDVMNFKFRVGRTLQFRNSWEGTGCSVIGAGS